MKYKLFPMPLFDDDNGVGGGVIDLAVKTGENTAEIEQLKADKSELESKLQSLEWAKEWTQDDINRQRDRLAELEQRVAEMEEDELNEESNNPGIHDETTEDKGADANTEIDGSGVKAEISTDKIEETVSIKGLLLAGVIAGGTIFIVKKYGAKQGEENNG